MSKEKESMVFRDEPSAPETEEDGNDSLETQGLIPLLPLRDIIVFPHMVMPLFAGRAKSIAALEAAMDRDQSILLAAQKDAKTNDPDVDDIHPVGTIGTIVQLLRLPDGTVKVLVEGKRRAVIKSFGGTEDFFEVTLKFNKVPKYMKVPYSAVHRFHDPSVGFHLQFEPIEGEEEAAGEAADAAPAAEPVELKPAKPKSNGNGESAEVVSLDSFRKK